MIKYFFSDVDDTITTDGRLEVEALQALYKLKDKGIETILVSGGSAAQALTYINQWPIKAIITETGALAYYRNEDNCIKKWINPRLDIYSYEDKKDKHFLEELYGRVRRVKLSQDSFGRLYDIAIDYNQVEPFLNQNEVDEVLKTCKELNVSYQVSSIHINCFFGNYNKKNAIEEFVHFLYDKSFYDIKNESAYAGDSKNDELPFSMFKYTFAVANIKKYLKDMKYKPVIVVKGVGSKGFAEIVDHLEDLSKFEKKEEIDDEEND